MPRTSRILLIFLMGVSSLAFGQEAQSANNAIGLNVTSVVSTFVGNDNSIAPSDIPLLLRFGKKRKIRLGLGAAVRSSEFFDVITQATRTTTEMEYILKVGFESQIFQEKKWGAYWGIDAHASFGENKVQAFFSQGSNQLVDTEYGAGGGPFVGITFHLSERIFLSAEGFLYAMFYRLDSKESGIGLPGNDTITSYRWELAAQPPLFLYLNYAF